MKFDEKTLVAYVNFLFEAGMLSRLPRSGFAFLGSGKQSVAEHSFRMTMTAFALAEMVKNESPVDGFKLLKMCLFHDLPEARTGDLNYVNKKYVKTDEPKVLSEYKEEFPFGEEISELLQEYMDNQSIEAIIAHDADQLELLLVLREEIEMGNPRAQIWYDKCHQRLQTDAAKSLAKTFLSTSPDSWWMRDPTDPHWIHGGKNSISPK